MFVPATAIGSRRPGQRQAATPSTIAARSSGGPYIQRTTGDYFTTMGLRLLRGAAPSASRMPSSWVRPRTAYASTL